MECLATLSMRGKKQILTFPEGFCFPEKEVSVRRKGKNIILTPKAKSWRDFFEKTPFPSEDFMCERIDTIPQKRQEVF